MTNPLARMLLLNQEKLSDIAQSSGAGVVSSFTLPDNFVLCFLDPRTDFIPKFKLYLDSGLDEFLKTITELYPIPMETSLVLGTSAVISEIIMDFLKKVHTEASGQLQSTNIVYLGLFFKGITNEIGLNITLSTGETAEKTSPLATIRAVLGVSVKKPGLSDILTMHVPGNNTIH